MQANAPLIYISYNHEDAEWHDLIVEHLEHLSSTFPGIDIWSDRKIQEGAEWSSIIQEMLDKANLAVVLLSPSYLASKTIDQVDKPTLSKRSTEDDLPIIPVLVRPCEWQGSWVERYQIASAQKALSELSVREVNRTLDKLKERITDLLKEPTPAAPVGLIPLQQLSDIRRSTGLQRTFETATPLTLKAVPHRPLTTGILLFALQEAANGVSYAVSSLFFSERYALRSADRWRQVRDKYLSPEVAAQEERQVLALKLKEPWQWVTPEAADVLRVAQSLAPKTGTADGRVHIRHLLGALLLYRPPDHETSARAALTEMGFDLPSLRKQFLDYLREHVPGDNMDKWAALLRPGGAPEPESESEPEPEIDPRRRMPEFSPDVYTEKDLLGIEDDVKGLATLIAARSVTPPLSIGLFGDWGSGKTFFMRHLRRQVEQIALDARNSQRPQSEIAFHKRIVQIEFNAWHYGEGNLWASLVEHIFQNLRLTEGEEDKEIKERQEHMLEQLALERAAQDKVTAEEQHAKDRLEAKEKELKKVKKEHEDEADQLAKLSKANVVGTIMQSITLDKKAQAQVNAALAAAGLPQLQAGAKDLQAALSAAEGAAQRGRSIFTALAQAEDRDKRLKQLVIILFGGAVVALLLGLLMKWLGQEHISQIAAVVGGLATTLTAGARWIKEQLVWVSDWLKRVEHAKEEVERAQQVIDKQVAQQQAENAAEIERHVQQLELLKADYLAVRREREEAERRVKQIQLEIQQQSPPFRLGQFIQDRAQSDDYRKHLGVLALIRRDFEQMSKFIDAENQRLAKLTSLKDELEGENLRVNRIVLYIDDLDRCPPKQVVDVLQAVHLLLAFPLFVVVVGVDGRWVARALIKQYPELLGGDTGGDEKGNGAQGKGATPAQAHASDLALRATPHDYLEKIFQIPCWLRPMDPTHTKRMLEGLLEGSLAKTNGHEAPPEQTTAKPGADNIGVAQPPAPAPPAGAPAQPHDPKQTVVAGVAVGAGGQQPAAAIGTSDTPAPNVTASSASGGTPAAVAPTGGAKTPDSPETDLNPAGLEINPEELKFMGELTTLLGRSPRAVKRFVNVYRLIKTGLTPEEQARFLRPVKVRDETPFFLNLSPIEQPQFLRAQSTVANFQIVMLLLSVTTGLPGIAREFFEELQDMHNDYERGRPEFLVNGVRRPPLEIEDLLNRLAHKVGVEDHVELGSLRDWLSKKADAAREARLKGQDDADWLHLPLARLADLAQRVARFSFRVKGL